jgi:hypothetical protein
LSGGKTCRASRIESASGESNKTGFSKCRAGVCELAGFCCGSEGTDKDLINRMAAMLRRHGEITYNSAESAGQS